jgi:CRISPR-associated protein Cmr6
MYPYSGSKLLDLLEKQHQKRSQENLLCSGVFKLNWRTKVGSFPHPDLETIVAAGEPCGAWKLGSGCPQSKSRPEDKRNLGDNLQYFSELPIYGYVPAASIRGLVRAWAQQHLGIRSRMQELLGWQNNDGEISTGKIEFLDAFPIEPTKLTLDIVNPQQDFQVFHQGQSTPLSFYTLGNGNEDIQIKIAIQGVAGKASPADVTEVWGWVQQALSLQGLGSRRASGYGAVTAPTDFKPTIDLPKLPEGYSSKILSFTLYSQGNAGPDMKEPEFRPAHWRGWLRSWLLRFLLGVMSVEDAKYTVGELLGTLQDSSDGKGRKGCVSIRLTKGLSWGEPSEAERFKRFYRWQGSLKITAPKEILNEIILPIVKFAVMLGGVGRGWRRPLHLFVMNNGSQAARGCHVTFTHKVKSPETGQLENKPFGIVSKPETWLKLYDVWASGVKKQWPTRFKAQVIAANAEVFSPRTCAIYVVDGPEDDPIDLQDLDWSTNKPLDTRGHGMELIYRPTYKRKPDVGGDAGGGAAHCSWVSIKRSRKQEIVCIFMGHDRALRKQFLKDLHGLEDSSHLFGLKPTITN